MGTATAVSGQSYTFTPSAAASGSTFNTSNTTFFVGTGPAAAGVTYGAAGTYFWLVHYHDNNLTSPNDRCETSTVSITN